MHEGSIAARETKILMGDADVRPETCLTAEIYGGVRHAHVILLSNPILTEKVPAIRLQRFLG
jgi:hypothetical protein